MAFCRRVLLRLLPALALLASSFVTGCGGSKAPGRKTAPVSGTVTFQGKPLAEAKVYFFSEKFSSYGVTDSEGKYRITGGAIPGPNKVFVTKVVSSSGAAAPAGIADDPGQVEAANAARPAPPSKGPKELLPPDVSNPELTKLTFQVPPEGADKADFSL